MRDARDVTLPIGATKLASVSHRSHGIDAPPTVRFQWFGWVNPTSDPVMWERATETIHSHERRFRPLASSGLSPNRGAPVHSVAPAANCPRARNQLSSSGSCVFRVRANFLRGRCACVECRVQLARNHRPAPGGRMSPEVLELLLQQVGSNGAQVSGQQFPQSDALLATRSRSTACAGSAGRRQRCGEASGQPPFEVRQRAPTRGQPKRPTTEKPCPARPMCLHCDYNESALGSHRKLAGDTTTQSDHRPSRPRR